MNNWSDTFISYHQVNLNYYNNNSNQFSQNNNANSINTSNNNFISNRNFQLRNPNNNNYSNPNFRNRYPNNNDQFNNANNNLLPKTNPNFVNRNDIITNNNTNNKNMNNINTNTINTNIINRNNNNINTINSNIINRNTINTNNNNTNTININNNIKFSGNENKKNRPKAKKNKELKIQSNLKLMELLNKNGESLYQYITTQKGSKDLQDFLKTINEKEVEILLHKLKIYLSDIIMDKYGNYFCKQLFLICLPYQRIQILDSIKERFIEISNNIYGTYPLQHLIEIINMPEEKNIVLSYILGNELILALNSKGTYILQKFISITKEGERFELNNNLLNLIDKLIINQSGVCVLIQLIKYSKDQKILQNIADFITKNGPLTYIQHPYANYIVQILLCKSSDMPFCKEIINTIIQNYLSLSMQKFTSNIVEKCLKYGSQETVKIIFDSIINDEKLESLLSNNYGNYVLEKLISRLNYEEKLIFTKAMTKSRKGKDIPNIIKNVLCK